MQAKKLYGVLFSICIASSFVAGVFAGRVQDDILRNNQHTQASPAYPVELELKGRTFHVTRHQLLVHEGSNIIFLSGLALGILVFGIGRLWDRGFKQLPPMQALEGSSKATPQAIAEPPKPSATERRP